MVAPVGAVHHELVREQFRMRVHVRRGPARDPARRRHHARHVARHVARARAHLFLTRRDGSALDKAAAEAGL